MADKKSLQGFVPDKNFVLGAFSMAGYSTLIQNFIDKVQQAPIPYIDITKAPGASDDTKAALKRVNDNMATHYKKIKDDAGNDQVLLAAINQKIGSLYNITRHAAVALKFINQEAQKGVNAKTKTVEAALNMIMNSIDTADSDLNKIDVAAMHSALEIDMGNLKSDMEDMQNAIPIDVADKLNLATLTETQAKDQLDKQIKTLNDQADTLQKQITWETVGQVGIGILGSVIAIVNVWNPIGWAAAAGTVTGEVFLAKDKAGKQAQLDLDRQQITLEEEEEEILSPYYTISQYKSQLNGLATGLEQIQKGITNIKTFADACKADIPGFISDLGDPESLALEYAAVVGTPDDPGDILSLDDALSKLMNWTPDKVDVDDNPTYHEMAEQGQWDQILNDPKSPYYIQILKDAGAVATS